MEKSTLFLRFASILGLLAVILGAFGAHSLETVLTPDQLDTFQVGVRYQFYHALAFLILALLLKHQSSPNLYRAGICFMIGIVLFSGSIYLLATRDLTGIWWGGLGIVTPIGGLFLILGWLFLILFTFSKSTTSNTRN